MRRNQRKNNSQDNFKNVLYVSGAVFLVALIGFIIAFMSYSNKLKVTKESIDTSKIAKVMENSVREEITEEASTKMGKTVEESENEIQNVIEESNNTNETNVKTQEIEKKEEASNNVQVTPEVVEDPTFCMPVDGEIIKEYAKENLVYSQTLQEWVTHNGIDIKAEKATVVKAAEEGTVTAIKSDPRYGVTVTIEHVNGYTTRYSNLLTSEFVVVGEKVIEGQTIGTVGNTAAFEIADEPHLHFELLKDNENLDPTLYIK